MVVWHTGGQFCGPPPRLFNRVPSFYAGREWRDIFLPLNEFWKTSISKSANWVYVSFKLLISLRSNVNTLAYQYDGVRVGDLWYTKFMAPNALCCTWRLMGIVCSRMSRCFVQSLHDWGLAISRSLSYARNDFHCLFDCFVQRLLSCTYFMVCCAPSSALNMRAFATWWGGVIRTHPV